MEDIQGSEPLKRACVRQVVVRREDGGLVPVRVADGVDGAWIRAALAARGLEAATLAYLLSDAENRSNSNPAGDPPVWFERAVGQAFPGARNIPWMTPDGSERITPSSTLLNLSPEYARAVAKVAFHYYLAFGMDTNGSEPEFEGVRDFICSGRGDPRTFVDLNGREIALATAESRPKYRAHVLMIESTPSRELLVRMRFFYNHPYTVPAVKVRLGQAPFAYELRIGHEIRLFGKRRRGFDGELIRRWVVWHHQDRVLGVDLS